jgi:ubiquinone/menaquinone biosynthesis C-methylase UbiE
VSDVSDISRFTSIDTQADPEFYVRLMDRANELAQVLEVERRATELLRLEPGGRVLELGCGTGEDTRRLAALVGAAGEAVGIDASETMITVARKRNDETGAGATFHVGDATAVDYPDGTFDAVRCERLLIHVPEPPVVLAEMVRLTRPGGRVLVIDVDYDHLVVDLPDVDLTHRVVHAMGDSMASGYIGRQLPRLFQAAGLADVGYECGLVAFPPDLAAAVLQGSMAAALASGLLGQADADVFWKSVEIAQGKGEGEPLVAFVVFIVSGTKTN